MFRIKLDVTKMVGNCCQVWYDSKKLCLSSTQIDELALVVAIFSTFNHVKGRQGLKLLVIYTPSSLKNMYYGEFIALHLNRANTLVFVRDLVLVLFADERASGEGARSEGFRLRLTKCKPIWFPFTH